MLQYHHLSLLLLLFSLFAFAPPSPPLHHHALAASPLPPHSQLHWKRLTAANFSSDIRQHPFVLCLATVPWCGESRSLMAEILRLIEEDFHLLSQLQLRFVYINVDKDLGFSLSSRKYPTFTFYRDAISYGYKGKLNAHSILAGIHHGIAISQEDLPLKRVDSSSMLESFLQSTDKAVILFDLCKWVQKLLQKQKLPKVIRKKKSAVNLSISHDSDEQENASGGGLPSTQEPYTLEGSLNQRSVGNVDSSVRCENEHTVTQVVGESCPVDDLESSMMSQLVKLHVDDESFCYKTGTVRACERESVIQEVVHSPQDCESETSTSPWGKAFGFASHLNISSLRRSNDNIKDAHSGTSNRTRSLNKGTLCDPTDYKKFKGFYRNLTKIAESNVLTPEQANFGIMTNTSLMSDFGLATFLSYNSSWFVMMQVADEPDSPEFFFGDEGLEIFLSSSAQLVPELGGEKSNYPLQLLNDTPSVILFIDRTSPLHGVKEKSREALQAIRDVARQYLMLEQLKPEGATNVEKSQKHKRLTEDVASSEFPFVKQLKLHVLDSDELRKLIDSNVENNAVEGETAMLLVQDTGGQILKKGLKTMQGMNTEQAQAVLQLLLENSGEVNADATKNLMPGSMGASDSSSYKRLEEGKIFCLQKDLLLGNQKMILRESITDKTQEALKVTGSDTFLVEVLNESEDSEGFSMQSHIKATAIYGQEEASSALSFRGEGAVKSKNVDSKSILFPAIETVEEGSEMREKAPEDGLYEDEKLSNLTESMEMLIQPVLLGLEYEKETSNLKNTKLQVEQLSTSVTNPRNDEKKAASIAPIEKEDDDKKIKPAKIAEAVQSSGRNDSSFNELDNSDHVKLEQLGEEEGQKRLLSFYFIDGDDQLRERLAMSATAPSLVIFDPQQHERYVFPRNHLINQTSLGEFLDFFVRGTLVKNYLSEPPPLPTRKRPQPPFINRDFHELEAVPRVTADSFSQMVIGYNAMKISSSPENLEQNFLKNREEMGVAWKKDVLVLFTFPSCGFCKRMELVLREVHHSMRKYLDWSSMQNRFTKVASEEQQFISESRVEFGQSPLPEELGMGKTKMDNQGNDTLVLLQMDCTANECSHLFGQFSQEESYPAVLLFPAGRKNTPVRFDGGPTVHEILEFLVVHGGTTSKLLYTIQGHAWRKDNDRKFKRKKSCLSVSSVPEPVLIESSAQEVQPLNYIMEEKRSQILAGGENSPSQVGVDGVEPLEAPKHPTVGSVLVATEKLLNVSTVFENSIILIVRDDVGERFQGLIVNMPLSWKTLPVDSQLQTFLNFTPLCYGGPVMPHGHPFLTLTRVKGLKGFSEVVPGVYFGDPTVTTDIFVSIKDLKLEAKVFWFFLGYTVWAWQQLLDELEAQLWQLYVYREDLIRWPTQKSDEGLIHMS